MGLAGIAAEEIIVAGGFLPLFFFVNFVIFVVNVLVAARGRFNDIVLELPGPALPRRAALHYNNGLRSPERPP